MQRVLIGLVVLGALIVAAFMGLLSYRALHAPPPTTDSGLTQDCAPGPCANVQGFTLWVSDITVTGDLVRMTVKFQNSSSATHVSPDDITLIDLSRHVAGLATDATGCSSFTRHDFKNGAVYGPLHICFHVTNETRPFDLHWSPALGTFCCEKDIKIT